MYKRFIKRAFDIIFSFFALLIFALPMLVVTIAVKCDSKGPAIFVQNRIGKNCKPFVFYKFRSMTTAAPKECATALLDSKCYITRLGKFLRKTSLDELPQLYNILKGDMSIIGPRPCMASEDDLVESRILSGAFRVKPGLTGWAQINGRDILAKNVEKKAEYDGYYSSHIGFRLDTKIFFLTILKVLKSDGVEEGNKETVLTIETESDINKKGNENTIVGDIVGTADCLNKGSFIEDRMATVLKK